VVGAVSYTAGIYGQGVQLNVNAWISWAMGAFANGTVEFWAKLDNITNCPTCGFLPAPNFVFAYLSPDEIGTGPGSTLVMTVPASDNIGYWHRGMPTASVHNGATWLGSPTNSVVIQPNTWHHYAFTWGDSGVHLYVDGNLLGVTGAVGGQNQGTSFWVVSNSGGLGFNGVMDELRISNIQRTFSAGPSIKFVKAFTLDYSGLAIGSNYQLQASSDLNAWTNFGGAFTATSNSYTNTNYQRIDDWNRLFFRLVSSP
jgi:hypothetical protein